MRLMLQSSKVLNSVLHEEGEMIKNMCQNFIKLDLLKLPIKEIDEFNPRNYLLNDKIFIGYECQEQIKLFQEKYQIIEFYNNILRFLYNSYIGIKTELNRKKNDFLIVIHSLSV